MFKENPSLFANKVFKYRHFNGSVGFVWKNLGLLYWLEEHNPNDFGRCQLIARRISDMTDEEREKWKHFIYDEKAPKSMISRYANQTAWLLSIGVYPFDQSHFETGEVLDAKEAV